MPSPSAAARRLLCACFTAALASVAAHAQATDSAARLGLYPATDFDVVSGHAGPRPAQRQAAWYFREQTIAVPRPGLPLAGYAPGLTAFDDLRRWVDARPADAPIDYPPLVWVAAPRQLRDARLADGGRTLRVDGRSMPLQLVPKIALNRSYADASSIAFFAQRELTLRGSDAGGGFVVRTLWPQDFRLGPAAPPQRALPDADSAASMRTLMREMPQGGARSPSAAATLWQRDGGDWAGLPVIGLMVNGAQGDDDEAHGGHFAIVTGRVQPDGSIGDWLVNNFYSLDVESEKGILAAPLPLDNYLGGLNAGQGWYRPSVMLVAVLRDERAAVLVQSTLSRVFNQFYRHQLVYYHPNQKCASISIDTLRALGWQVPARGPTSRALAWAAYPVVAVKDLSIAKAKLAFDYLRTDQTRLLPAAALEQAFAGLKQLAVEPATAGDGVLARLLAQDLQALAFVRLPQFPSSRAVGIAPAASTWEYRTRVPSDPAMAQIVPVPPRPFPPELRDADLRALPWAPSDHATLVWGLIVAAALAWALWRWRRAARRRG